MSARIGLRRRHRRHKRAARWRRIRRRYIDSALANLSAQASTTRLIYQLYRERHVSPQIHIPYLRTNPCRECEK